MNTNECGMCELVGPQFREVLAYVIRWKWDAGSRLRFLEVRSYTSMNHALFYLDPFVAGDQTERFTKMLHGEG